MYITSNNNHSHSFSINNYKHTCERCNKVTTLIHDYTDTIHFTTSFYEPESESTSTYLCTICDIKDRLNTLKYKLSNIIKSIRFALDIACCGKVSLSKRINVFVKIYKHIR